MDAAQGSISSSVSKLDSSLSSVNGAWKGAGGAAFVALMQRWNTDAKALNQALTGFRENLTGTAKALTQADENEAASLAKLVASLG